MPDLILEPVRFLKGSDSIVEGWGMPFFGPLKIGDDPIGRDFDGEFFSPNTDFVFEWFKGDRPLLYQHTLDRGIGTEALGTVLEHQKLDAGIWTRSQLDLRSQWYEAVRELIRQGALSFSSGAYPPAVTIDKSGEILRWPWVELTLTPTPANPYASIQSLKTLGLDALPPEPPEAVTVTEGNHVIATIRRYRIFGKAAWSSAYINDLPDSAFACVNGSGRHYPHHNADGALDLPHLRAALSRIGDPANEQCGKGHLAAHARAAGVGD